MEIGSILLLFAFGCVMWIITQIAWKIIEGKLLLKLQNQKIDALYAKLFKLILKGKKDLHDMKEYEKRYE